MPPQNFIFLILTLLSHVVASVFFAKPRFNLLVTSLIWIGYAVVCFILPVDTPTLNFFVSFVLHFILKVNIERSKMPLKTAKK